MAFLKKDFIDLFLERGEDGEKEGGKNINVWLSLARSLLGTWPTAQACALTGNRTRDPLVCRLVLCPLSHRSCQSWPRSCSCSEHAHCVCAVSAPGWVCLLSFPSALWTQNSTAPPANRAGHEVTGTNSGQISVVSQSHVWFCEEWACGGVSPLFLVLPRPSRRSWNRPS